MDDSWTNASYFEDPAMGNLDDIFATFFTPQHSSMIQQNAPPACPTTAPQFPMDAAEPSQDVLHTGEEDNILQFDGYTTLPPLRVEFDEYYDDTMTTLLTPQHSSMPIQQNAPPAYPLTAPQFPMDAAEPSQDMLHTGEEDTILQFGPPLRVEFDECYYSDDTMTTLLTGQLSSMPIQQNNVPRAWPWTTPQFPTDAAEPSQDMLHTGEVTIFQLGGYTSQPPVSSSTDTGQGAAPSPSGRTSRHSRGSSSRPYHPFTFEDVIQLIYAVIHHGRRWRRIIQSPHFLNSGRTRGQLMEKWRDMLKTAERQRDPQLRELYMLAKQIDASLP